MRMLGILILLVGFVSTNAGAQGWTKAAGGLNQVSAFNETTAWGVNKSDEIYRTQDAGKTWQRVPGALRQVSALSYDSAWGVNGARQIWRTNNGGGYWDLRPGSLKQVSAADFNTAWGVNDADEIWRTNNGGVNWDRRPGLLSQISALSFESAWGVNAAGQVWRTNNGGGNWDNRPGQLKWVSAVSYDEAAGVNAQDGIYRTRDGGATWQEVPGSLQQISALSYESAWGVNSANDIFVRVATNAGAQAGGAAASPLRIAGNIADINQVGFGDGATGLITGKLRKISDGKWVIAKDDQALQPQFTEIARDPSSITLRHDNYSLVKLDLAEKTIRVISASTSADFALVPAPSGGNPGAARIIWTMNEGEVAAYQKYANKLKSPLNKADLNAVMRWIGAETSAAQVDYCYRNSAPREGFPWQVGDAAGDFTRAVSRCESKFGIGKCEIPIAVAYPACGAGKYGDGPICWQYCPTTAQVLEHGQNTKVDCGIGCALNNDVCAEKIADMVLAPVNMALNIVSLGLSGAASNSAKQAAKAAVDAGGEAITEVALNSSKWAKLSQALAKSEAIFDKVNGAKDKLEYLVANVENLETELERWNGDYESDFAELTSSRIEAEIDRRFPNPDDRSYIKQKFGQYQLTALMSADEWRIWGTVATATSIEPTGVIATVKAFAQPMCRERAEPFPDVTILPTASRGAPDPLIRAQ